jgi:hypothetical protein
MDQEKKQPHEININNPIRWTHEAKAFAESASILELVETCERYGRDFSTEEAGVRYDAAARELRQRDPHAFDTWCESEAYSPRQFFVRRPDLAGFDAMRRALLRPEASDGRSGPVIEPELYR